MKCPFCVEENKNSCVYPGVSTSTLLAWTPYHYDENGEVVWSENPNTITTQYRCSNGHTWTVEVKTDTGV